ncbi:hypothetical protein DI09_12p60 [Mitosporidium daphniae]|uniref:Uncharacterized protein n=1 Tax=Mitosporidium daphniae TaxID=1485682 RepID=A0A098VUR1_9MICR|nr:uncharacterized protein DI09_12p60 [Mitosporidium daphniae]KGG52838.1 hypothetical protein DI09_12p60 [Mitosporidium daphniae]|eukprot:XP_013239310.1 uncharacterized protein DI09_12p60 [Mitosporidium daphniae]
MLGRNKENAAFNLDVLAGMQGLLSDLKPHLESSHKKIFSELIDELKPSLGWKSGSSSPLIVLLQLFFYFSSQQDRAYLMRIFIDRLSGNSPSRFGDISRSSSSLISQFESLINHSTALNGEACQLFLAYIFNTLKWLEMTPRSDVTRAAHLHHELELFFCEGHENTAFNGAVSADPRLCPSPAAGLSASPCSMLHINMRMISDFFKATKPKDPVLDNLLGLKCWELASFSLVKLYPFNASTAAIGTELICYLDLDLMLFPKFDSLPLEVKVQLIELVAFVRNDTLKDTLVANCILPYFSNSYTPPVVNTAQDVDFCFILVSKIFKIVTTKTMRKFLASFIQNATNDKYSIFSILTLDQKMRLEQALFIGSKRVFSETPDLLAQFLNLYATLRKRYIENAHSAPSYACSVDVVRPIYKWNSHVLIPIYGVFGYNSMTAFLEQIEPSLFLKDPRILVQALSLFFSFSTSRLTEGCRLLIDKLRCIPKEDMQISYRKDSQNISSQHAFSAINDICRAEITSSLCATIQLKNIFPDVLFRENLSLASICSFFTDHGAFILLVELAEKHPLKTVSVGTLYRAMMSHFYKQRHLFSYCALLKRILETQPIEIFISSHESHSCSVKRSFYRNVMALIVMNDALLLLIYLKRLSVCTILLKRLNGPLVSFINDSISALNAGYSEESVNIPYYLSVQFCRENMLSRKLRSMGVEKFFSSQPANVSLYDLSSRLDEIKTCGFLDTSEKEILLDTLQAKPYLVNMLNALKMLKENKTFVL